jgi:F0F1-type ATP synthase assembly protein I
LKKNKPEKKPNEAFDRWAFGYNLAMKFTVMLLVPVFAGLACGIWLDRQLQTSPWLMFILTGAGFIFSIYAVYRVATRQ